MATPGAGAQEQVNPFAGTTPADVNRRLNIWDPLFRSDSPQGNFEPYLAETAEPNADGTVWQIKLRAGVTTHNGKTLTTDDAIWSIQQAGDVEAGNYGSPFGNFMDLATGLKKVDDVTFEMHLNQPVGDIGAISRDTSSIVAPMDWNADPAKPIGTGPFKFESFTPGERSLFSRNENYWIGEGKPYLDELEIISILDPAARANALTAGEVDAVENFDFLQAQQLQGNPAVTLLAAPSEWTIPFMTRFDMDPFQDNKVRKAFKYAIDRQATVDSAFFGFGDIGNDQFGKNGPPIYYNSELPQREYDPERAKSLLAEAGFPDGLDVTLTLSPACGCQGPEGVNTLAAQAFQQQAKAAGINFDIENITDLDQWNVLSYPFSATWWSPGVPFVYYWFTDPKVTGYNEGWVHPEWDKLYLEAVGTLDEARRAELWQEIQAQFYEESGHIIWGHYNLIDGLSPNVQGAYVNTWPLGSYDFKSFWLA
jgi:peptide/nickel transport system substrate-binding protein